MNKHTRKRSTTLGLNTATLFFLALGGCLVLTVWGSTYVQQTLSSRSAKLFSTYTERITDSIIRNTSGYEDLLQGTRAYVASSELVTQEEWTQFFRVQHTLERNPGVSSISRVERIGRADVPGFVENMRRDGSLGTDFAIKPAGSREEYAVASLVYSNYDLSAMYGFDVFSTPDRKAVYILAAERNAPVASAPLKLTSGHYGFFIVLPVISRENEITQYVVLTMRADDFMSTLIDDSSVPITIRITDITDGHHPVELYISSDWSTTSNDLSRSDTITFSERTWQVEYKTAHNYDDTFTYRYAPGAVYVVGILVICCLMLIYLNRRKASSS